MYLISVIAFRNISTYTNGNISKTKLLKVFSK